MRLYRRKDSPYWWVQGYDAEGNRKAASTKQRDKGQAAKAGRATCRRWLLEATEGPRLELGEALEMLRAHKQRKGCAPATMEVLAEKGGHLLAVFGAERNVCALTLADTEGYVSLRQADGVSLHTIQKELGTLRAALRQASRHGLYPHDTALIWPEELRDVYTPRERWLPIEEYRLLYAALAPKRRDHLAVYCHTGVRYSELYRPRAEDVDHAHRRVWIDGTKTKAAKRWVPLDADAWEVVERRAQRGGLLFPDVWESSWMSRELKAACERAGIAPVSANDLRRTFASWMANAGVPEPVTARLMGHTTSAMVRRVYAQHAPETMREAVDRLPSLRSDNVAAPPANGASGATNAPTKQRNKGNDA